MNDRSGVPLFNIQEFNPRKNDYCICVFVINEGSRIRNQLKQMHQCNADIVIADGGSTDGSLETSFLKSVGIRTLLTKTDTGRLSAQMRMAFFYALSQGYKGIITIDGNNKDDVGSIDSFLEKLEQGYDHIQGSRYIEGGKGINTPLLRHIGVKYLHAPLIRLASGFHYTDTTNGFRAYSASFLQDIRVNPFRDIFTNYELHYYLAIRSAQLGYRLTEIPVTRSYPKTGKTPTKISPLKGNIEVLINLFLACLGKYNPPESSVIKK